MQDETWRLQPSAFSNHNITIVSSCINLNQQQPSGVLHLDRFPDFLDIAMLLFCILLLVVASTKNSFAYSTRKTIFRRCRQPPVSTLLFSHDTSHQPRRQNLISSFDEAVMNRYACTRFQRFDNRNETLEVASPSNPKILQQAYTALDLARRAPSGFNSQPYKVLLVSSNEQKEALAQYCIGHNAHRVRDSDCTAIFLADREVVKTFGDFSSLISQNSKGKPPKGLFKMKLLIAMFSSGFPFPKVISGPISWAMRFGMRVVSWITRGWYPVPTLTSSEAWSQKNTMLVAMTYLLACSSRQVATCPMEGYLSWGIRKALKIPRRYTIPLIVATGTPYIREDSSSSASMDMATDDTGVSHGPPSKGSAAAATPRFAFEHMVYENTFGNQSDL
jgi:nitroreductase